MGIFLVQWNCPDYNDHQTSVYSDELTARKDICVNIQQAISNIYFETPLQVEEAKKINDLISDGTLDSYRKAIRIWNDSQLNFDNKPEYWSCYEAVIQESAENPEIFTPDFFDKALG